MTRFRIIFKKSPISKRLIDKHSYFAHKEMSLFCFSDCHKYSVMTVSYV